MRVDKLIKKIHKATDKNSALANASTSLDDGSLRFDVDSVSRTAFRWLRDQFDGPIQSDIDWVYKIGGSMTLLCFSDRIQISTYDDHGRVYQEYELRRPTTQAA